MHFRNSMANFSGTGFSFPSPAVVSTVSHVPTFTTGFVQFTPNSTTGTTSIQFPSPMLNSPSQMAVQEGRGGIMSSASENRPTTSHRMPASWQPLTPWTPNEVNGAMNKFTAAAANFNNSLSNSTTRTNPVPSTSTCMNSFGHNKAKRRMDVLNGNDIEQPPVKILVNEERMAARMEELHLDNNNLDWHPDLEEQQQARVIAHRTEPAWYTGLQADSTSEGMEDNLLNETRQQVRPSVMLSNCSSSTSSSEDYDSDGSQTTGRRRQRSKSCPKLELSDELKLTQTDLEFALKTRNRLPEVLLKELTKPCLQVVLWKPPGDHMKDIITASGKLPVHSNPVPESSRELDETHPSVETEGLMCLDVDRVEVQNSVEVSDEGGNEFSDTTALWGRTTESAMVEVPSNDDTMEL